MNQQAKTKRSFPYVGLILWVTLALVVLILGYTLMDTVGIPRPYEYRRYRR